MKMYTSLGVVFCALYLAALGIAEGRTLQTEHLKRWLASSNLRPIELNVNGDRFTVHENPGLLTRYFAARETNTLTFDRDFDPLIGSYTPLHKQCADDVRENLYRFRDRDPPIEMLEDIDWSIDPLSDPNWQLQFHRLTFLDCMMIGFIETRDEWYIDRLKWVVADWIQDNMHPDPANPRFAWYDHAIPIRMINIVRAFEFLRREERLDRVFVRDALRLVAIHADILADEEFIYKRGHNHGLDQSFRLLQVAHYFPEMANAEHWRATALERISFETSVAMTDEGVHVENSPMYHDGISVYIAKIFSAMVELGEDTPEHSLRFQQDALAFTTAILRPDGAYPQLGDSAPGREPRARYPDLDVPEWMEDFRKRHPGEQHFAWEQSGYYVYRNGWDQASTHVVVKCGFLSGGHRHHDDGNILLYAAEEDWLIDSGMYGYSSDPDEQRLRNAVMQPEAHNISMPLGATPIRQPYGSGLSSIPGGVGCETPMFEGHIYTRQVRVSSQEIEIMDSFQSEEPSEYQTLFRVPIDKTIAVDGSRITISSVNHDIAIEAKDATGSIQIVVGDTGDFVSIETTAYREHRDAQTIIVPHEGTARFTIDLSGLPGS